MRGPVGTPRARAARVGFVLLATSVLGGSVRGADNPPAGAPAWQITRADVRVVCPLTVGGSFEARATSMTGTLALTTPRPLALAGDVSVDLRTLDTGISMRNGHMRDNYLEVGRGAGFDAAVLSDIRLPDGDAATLSGRTRFSGTLLLHGTRRAVAGDADVRRDGSSVRVDAAFAVRLEDYAIAPPRYLGVGVKDEVMVKVSLTATPAPTADGPR
ncbi:MAG TPA: YceI family protein [Vicinamibacteria bacterium]|nr:YceI family protein [Vicinamibacteria bacterium]